MVGRMSRVNGWSMPLHPLQLLAWFLAACLLIMSFLVLVTSFESSRIRLCLNLCMGFITTVNIILNVVVTSIDPADDAVQRKIKGVLRPNFDRQQHAHVIDQNFFCNICETIINQTSKHCRQCNKCVLNFDHHCKWLNNCIGAKNYRVFLVYVISTLIIMLFIFVLTITELVFKVYFPHLLINNGEKFRSFGVEINTVLWTFLLSIVMLISLIILCLTAHLLIFHARLISKGHTTYTYIMMQRQKQENEQAAKDQVIPIITIEHATMPNGRRSVRIVSKLPRYKNRYWQGVLKVWRFVFGKKRRVLAANVSTNEVMKQELQISPKPRQASQSMIPQVGDMIIDERPNKAILTPISTPPSFKFNQQSILPSILTAQDHLLIENRKNSRTSLASDGESTVLSSVSSIPTNSEVHCRRTITHLTPIVRSQQQNKTPVYSSLSMLQMDDLEKQFSPYIYDVDYYDVISCPKDRTKLYNNKRRNNCLPLKSGLYKKSDSSMVAAEM